MYAIEQTNLEPPRYTDDTPIQRIVILVAMLEEALPMLEVLRLTEQALGLNPALQLRSFSGTVNGHRIDLVVNGAESALGVARVGTEFATLSTYEVIQKLSPDTIISAGTAGGYADKGARVGDVYLSSKHFCFHDRQIPLSPEYIAYSRGRYPCLEAPSIARALNLKTGVISSGNSLTVSASDQATIIELGSVAKEMEVAAIANVARLFGVRVLAVKAITNLAGVEANAAEQFETNFRLATTELANVLPQVITHLLGATPRQLQNPLTLVSNELTAPAPVEDSVSWSLSAAR